MPNFLGYSVVRFDGLVVVSKVRLNTARRKVEELGSSQYQIREMWDGAPVSAISKEHTKGKKKK